LLIFSFISVLLVITDKILQKDSRDYTNIARGDNRGLVTGANILHMAEIELSVLARQVLCQRIGLLTEMERQVAAWQTQRNKEQICVNWHFTTADARIKLKRLYLSIEG
jgi:recombinational DNA repair ATPase RecF